MSGNDRLAESKAAVSEAISSVIKSSLKLPELLTHEQGAQLTELASSLVAKEPLIRAACNTAQQQLPRAASDYASSLEAAARPVGRLLSAAGRLEAVLAAEEAAARQAEQEEAAQ
ncbi:hypothetical protein CHLRE_09g393750v5 [Chlamydomonas reinhardtii]|uniref:Uncharacterized protein n=1 Tax=Chlamydomonas reinhardtii TaxID=3055 RepID=A0A2K3DDA6_CHLRE|nr:uncharacterized protein CHLRE_09g393750v5 [Chlamydomonas reinhardtii]PNW78522.1 hypothetical protein CHLRE_09g393750v5 [Chlamydomonas reinhardtii]